VSLFLFVLDIFIIGDIERYSRVMPLRAQAIAAIEKWYEESEMKEEIKEQVLFLMVSLRVGAHYFPLIFLNVLLDS
jgi:hypothetical protein